MISHCQAVDGRRLGPFSQALGLSVATGGTYSALITLVIAVVSPEFLLFALPTSLQPQAAIDLVGIWTLIHLAWIVVPMSAGLALIWAVGSLPVLPITWLLRAMGRLLATISVWSAAFAFMGALVGFTLEKSVPADASREQKIVTSSEFRSMEMLAFSSMIVGWTSTMLLVGRISAARTVLEAASTSTRGRVGNTFRASQDQSQLALRLTK